VSHGEPCRVYEYQGIVNAECFGAGSNTRTVRAKVAGNGRQ